jgi:putative aldouronate transport system substrate-binding protein
MKKLLAAMLIIMLAAPAAGCSNTPKPNPSPTPVVKTQVSIGLPNLRQAVSGKISGAMQQYFINKFGIEFVPWQPSGSGWEAGIQAAAASKSLPDMFSQGVYGNAMLFKDLIDQKLVREIPEGIYKNYQYLGTAMYRYAKTENVGGKMYFVPRTDMAQQYSNGNSVAIYYRLDWALESKAFTAGQTPSWKQFMDLMNAFHGDPDKNGTVDTWGLTSAGPGLGGLKTAFLMTFGVRDWVLEDGKWMPGVLSSRAKEAVQWANQAFRSSCLDPSFSTQTEAEALDKFCSGQAGMLVYDASPAGAEHLYEVLKLKQPGLDIVKAVSVLPQPVDPWGVSYNEDVSYSTGTLFSTAVDDKKLEKVFTLMDWLFSPDGLTYASWGEKSKDYNVTGSGLQTLHKNEKNLPITFGALNEEWSAMASLSTWGKDFIADTAQDTFSPKYLSQLHDFWWTNNWRRPLFTRYMFDASVQNFDKDGKAEAALAELIKSQDIETDWAAYVAQMTTELNVDAVAKIVNDYAAEHKITTEE